MSRFILIVALLAAAAVWAFPDSRAQFVTAEAPSFDNTPTYLPYGTTDDGATAYIDDGHKGALIDGDSEWDKGTVTRYRTVDRTARLNSLREFNAPPSAPEGQSTVVIIQNNVDQTMVMDRKRHNRRQRTARQAWSSPLPGSE